MSYYAQSLVRESSLHLTPDDLLSAAAEYFEWVEAHPLLEERMGFFQGEPTYADCKKMRAFTKSGLASFLGMTIGRFEGLKDRAGFAEAVARIDQVIYTQKFEGAAAGLLSASLVARDLGLADKQDLTSSDGTMTPTATASEAAVLDLLRAKHTPDG